MKTLLSALICSTVLYGCGGSTTPPATPQSGTIASDDDASEAVRPDTEKLKTHLAEHLQLPSNREQVLAACDQTPEFTAAEKLWIANTLQPGDYLTPEDVSVALGL
ncbi:MAG: hypothetical protein HRU17_18820 [Polyangiaceae bacterium]|nr:hypothetical protein [Polyangiaceae bacterium]